MALVSYNIYKTHEKLGAKVMNFVEMVLAAVEEKGEVCAQDIADSMQIPESIVAGVLNKLEAEGLLKAL